MTAPEQTDDQFRLEALQLMADNTPDVFWMANATVERILYVSPGYESLWGRPAAELAENPRTFALAVHPDDRTGLWDLDRPRTTPWEAQYRIVRPDGSVRWVRGRGFPVLEPDGTPRCFAGTVTDITELKQAQEELARRAQLAEQVAEVAGRLAAATPADPDQVLRDCLERIGRQAGADRAAIGELGEGVAITHEWHSDRVPGREGETIPFPPELLELAAGAVRASPGLVPFSMPDEVRASGLIEASHMEMVPLLAGEEMFGILGVSSMAPERPWSSNLRVALHSLGSVVASTITRVRAERRAQRRQDQLRSLSARLALTEERERKRIAGILHDEVGQELALLKLQLGMLGRQLPDRSAGLVTELRERVSQLIDRTRALTSDMAPPALFKLGLASALEALASDRSTGLEVVVRESGEPMPLGEGIQLFAWRATRELLTNAMKHAHASRMVLTVLWNPNGLELVFDDDGCGFDPRILSPETGAETPGFGLIQLRERLQHMGGAFAVRSQPGEGTVVTLTVPLGVQ